VREVNRRACLAFLFATGCEGRRAFEAPRAVSSVQRPSYAELRARLLARRDALAHEGANETRAKQELERGIVEDLLPAWLGTKWAFHGTADAPQAPQGIACGYFVATILEHAGLRLQSRRRFGQATALAIERALVPSPKALHRISSVPASVLERKMLDLGPGLYVMGLDVHVGFVVVRPDAVRFVHASYLGKRVVVDEPIAASEAIERSRDAGYVVTSLFADDALATAWLRGTTIHAPT
jgi:hypothetical protein